MQKITITSVLVGYMVLVGYAAKPRDVATAKKQATFARRLTTSYNYYTPGYGYGTPDDDTTLNTDDTGSPVTDDAGYGTPDDDTTLNTDDTGSPVTDDADAIVENCSAEIEACAEDPDCVDCGTSLNSVEFSSDVDVEGCDDVQEALCAPIAAVCDATNAVTVQVIDCVLTGALGGICDIEAENCLNAEDSEGDEDLEETSGAAKITAALSLAAVAAMVTSSSFF